VLPIAGHWMNGENRIDYWHKDLQSVVSQGATDQLACGTNIIQDLSSIHLIYAGDHGQGAFRSAMKLLFTKGDAVESEYVSECIANIGHINCGKDNYQVLQNTYIPIHDKMMAAMQRPQDRLCIPIRG